MEYKAITILKSFLISLLILAFALQGSFFSAFAYDETEHDNTVVPDTASEEVPGNAVNDISGAISGDAAGDISGAVSGEVAGNAAGALSSEKSDDNFGNVAVVNFLPKDKRSTMQSISFPILDTKTVTYDWTFPYSDQFFRRPSDSFSISLAQGSLGLALSAFRSTPDIVDPQYETYLRKAGFTNLYSFGYDKPTTDDSLSGTIGMKKIGDFTLIAAVPCGQGYGNEWAGNLRVGKGDRHEGFNTAAMILKDNIKDYIRKNNIDGKKKLWLTGMSRAGAVGNITAADMIESGEFDDVYAYLFGVPRTTKKPVRYSGIFNICGQYDPVPSVPLQSWGYERYGTDLYTPAQETDTSYTALAAHVDKVSKRLTDKKFRNNPEINFQLHLILEFLGEFFESSDEYAERLQGKLIEAWHNHDPEQIAAIIKGAMAGVVTNDSQEDYSKRVFIDYISYIAAQHMRYDQRQVRAGSWDTTESLAANIALEHRPSTYVKWLFAKIDAQDMLQTSLTTRRISFEGEASIMVYKDGRLLTWIDEKGKVYKPKVSADNQEDPAPMLFMMKNGIETVVSLPDDEDYYIEIETIKGSGLSYYDVTLAANSLMGRSGKMRVNYLQPGLYAFSVIPGEDLTDPEAIEGKLSGSSPMDFEYSPTVIMSDELQSTRTSYLSLSNALIIISCVLGFLLLLGIVCIIISAINRYRRKRLGHGPFSDWYVIIPHIIVIAVFAVMTQFLTFFLFSIGRARAECAVICVLFIFLLALRGSIRSRTKSSFAYTGFVFALVPLTQLFYHNFPLDSFSRTNMVLYFLIIALLIIGAVRTFPFLKKQIRKEQKQKQAV